MIYRYLAFGMICISCSATALIERAIDEKKAIDVVFSKNSHNRISVEKGSVDRIFGDSRIFSITIDRMTGNAFIDLCREIPDSPMTLTVVTRSGYIQDLSVSSCEGASEHLLLKEAQDLDEPLNIMTNFHGATVEFLNSIFEGKVPFGYGQREVVEGEALELPRPLLATPIKAFEGPFESIAVYRIENTGQESIVLEPMHLKKDQHLWIFLNTHKLKKNEQTLCVISFPKT